MKDKSIMRQALSDIASLENYLKTRYIDSQDNKTGNTLLHYATSEQSDFHIMEFLIVQGASPYIKNKRGKRVIESNFFQTFVNHVLETHKPNLSKKICYVYLAGPEVFLPFSFFIGNFIKAQIFLFNSYYLRKDSYSIKGIYPSDSGFVPKNMNFQEGVKIYMDNVDIMNRCHAIIANMVRFRGPGMDGGTAFEMGYMNAQKKVIIGYYDEKPYFDKYKENCVYMKKVAQEIGYPIEKTFPYDKNNLLIESFKMPDNLMMVVSTLTQDRKLNIPGSSWEALFLLKENLDMKSGIK